MYMLGIAVLGVFLKYMEVGPFAAIDWWWYLVPFGLTMAWWMWADASGYTRRRAMERMDLRKQERINKNKEAMGIRTNKRR